MGEGGIGIVRLSGPRALEVAEAVFRPRGGGSPRSQRTHTARYGRAVDREGTIDEALCLVMRAPKSYTCEDVAEISVHGGPAVLRKLLAAAIAAGARPAGPGEFTRRAFLNGRLDLLQAEAVADLVTARSERSRRWASSQLAGSLSRRMAEVKASLVEALSTLEAAIDFPEDETGADPESRAPALVERATASCEQLLKTADAGLAAKSSPRAVLCGKPNVGKSSLLNRLVGADRAIVTPYPGTTRDAVEADAQLAGFPLTVVDTAGMRDSTDPIEKEGVERSRRALDTADLVICVFDRSRPLDAEDEAVLSRTEGCRRWLLLNKADLPAAWEERTLSAKAPGVPVVLGSTIWDDGMNKLVDEISRWFLNGVSPSEETVLTSLRQKELLKETVEALQRARQAIAERLSPEFVATDIRVALDRLAELAGESVDDAVLEALFSRFCIGK